MRWQKRAIELIFIFMANDKHTDDDDVDYNAVRRDERTPAET